MQEKTAYDPAQYLHRIHPEDRSAIETRVTEDALRQLIDQNANWYFECRMRRVGGWHWYSHTILAVPRSHSHPASYILFRKDIDTTKQVEAAQHQVLKDALETARHASEAKGSFLSRMSHEIRTPLNAIIGYLTLAQLPDAAAAKIQHCLKSSEAASRHLLSIINDVLDISAIESGRFKISQEAFNLRQHLLPITQFFYTQAKEKKITFDSLLQNVDEEWILGDALRIKQILMNLLSNAIKFTPAGGQVTLTVQQTTLDAQRLLIKFIVTDTGIGMRPEYLTRIFTPFEQESAETAQNFGGTGLGLSITKNLVSLMHGSIEVNSMPQQGSTFTVSLPFQIAPQDHSPEKERNLLSTFSHVHALVVDDKPEECDYLQSLLNRCSVRSDAVTSGRSALNAIQQKEPTADAYDFCILDWKMPDMDGVETARRIRQASQRDLPIIVITAYDTNEVEEAALAAGARRVIAKPLFPSTIFDLLVTYFGHHNKPEPATPQEKHQLSGIHILLVEDNEMNREIAVAILQESGLSIETAINGKDAVEQFTASAPGTYQCIFMDIQMPVMNGYDATRAIRRSSHPEAATIPIIAVTADVFSEDVARALACGMNDYISKPIDYKKLIQALLKFTSPTQ